MRGQLLESVKEAKDLGIWLSSDMKVSQQCSKACSKAYRMSGLIKRTIENKNKEGGYASVEQVSGSPSRRLLLICMVTSLC